MNLVKNSLSNLKNHKLRVFTTLIWIVIGITSVILVTSIGNGLRKEVADSVSKINPNKTSIQFEPHDYNMQDMSIFMNPFSNVDFEDLSFVEGVEKITSSNQDFLYTNTDSEAIYDKKNTYLSLSNDYKDLEINPVFGNNFTLDDEDRNVILISLQNATDLFGDPKNAIGKGITINNLNFEVIGVIDENSIKTKDNSDNNTSTFGYSDNYHLTSFIPMDAFKKLINQNSYQDEIYSLDLIVSDGFNISDVSQEIINRLYELHPQIDGSYTSFNDSENIDSLENMVSSINIFIALITFISMFVGGIGVMNIMYISVIERQREIGIRRAVGAKPKDILFQILSESIFITLLGGIIGIFIGFIGVNIISNYLPFNAIININSILYSVISIILTGIISGIIPAIKASKLNPINAIYK